MTTAIVAALLTAAYLVTRLKHVNHARETSLYAKLHRARTDLPTPQQSRHQHLLNRVRASGVTVIPMEENK